MRYVLDTNALSAIMKGHPTVLSRLEGAGRSQVSVPQPALAEIAYGIAWLPRSRRRQDLFAMYTRLAGELGRCPWTDEVTEHFGQVKAELERRGEPLEDFDIAIAAHALAHRATLVTANSAHMSRIGTLALEDWEND